MKSQDNELLLSVAVALLEDAQLACAFRSVEKERDLARLTAGAKARGLAFFTLDLPSCDAILLAGLESGKVSPRGPLTRRRSKVDCRPRFLHGLWSLVFSPTGCLLETADPNAIFYLRSLFCLGKKIKSDCSDERLNAALKEYHDIESAVVPPQLAWDEDDLGEVTEDLSFGASFRSQHSSSVERCEGLAGGHSLDHSLKALDFVSRVLVSELGMFDSMSDNTPENGRFKHGPGAVADARQTHFKYVFPHWPSKLNNIFPFDYCGSHSIDVDECPSEAEPPSKLIAVPKTAKGPRLIASEPIAHQWCQQKILTWLDYRFSHSLVGSFVNLHDQEASQTLVRVASITRELSTLDLSSASDRVSCRHVESLFRVNLPLLRACHAVRTRRISDRLSKPARILPLKKFAAMGSALTFPVQSLFFLCCCLAACGVESRRDIERLKGQVRVYGDDLIVPSTAHAPLIALLTHLGLKVNVQKSFSAGHFRESCGMDCWKGYDVTPIKPKVVRADAPETCQAVIDVANNFFNKGCWHAASLLDSTLRAKRYALPVVGRYSGVPGLTSFCGAKVSHLQRRWNAQLHKEQIRFHMLLARVKRVRQDVSATLLQYFTEDPDPLMKWSSGVVHDRSAVFAPRWVAAEDVLCPV